MTILIVGAGAAGLTAAYTLVQEGYTDFKILEASSRLGGRVKKLENFASFPIDIGAEWLHVEKDVLAEITQDDSVLDSIETVRHIVDSYKIWTPETQFNGFDYMDDPTGPDAPPDLLTDLKFVNYTWFDFFNDTIAVPQVRDSIVYDCPVTVIDYSSDDGGVIATCEIQAESNATNSTTTYYDDYEGSHIVVTVPLPILKDGDIEFIPDLPESHWDAIDNITMPAGYKIFLKFQPEFAGYPDIFESSTDEIGLLFYDETFGQPHNPNEHVLGVFVSAESAKESSSWPDDKLTNHVLELLDEMFDGNATKYFVEAVVQNWVQEPYVRGTYSHYSSFMDIDDLKEPINGTSGGDGEPVLYLAGEALPATHTDYGNGYAHGAALSGKEAAEWIMESIQYATTNRQGGGGEQEPKKEKQQEENGEDEDKNTIIDTSSSSSLNNNNPDLDEEGAFDHSSASTGSFHLLVSLEFATFIAIAQMMNDVIM